MKRENADRGHLECVARELRKEAPAGAADAVVVEELRNQSDADLSRGPAAFAAMGRDMLQRGKEMTVDGRRFRMQRAIGFAVVGRMEMRPWRGAHRVSEVLRRIGEERIHRRSHRSALGGDRLARRGDGRDQGRELEAPQRRGLERARSRVRLGGCGAVPERLSRDAEPFPELRRIRAQPAQLAELLLESRDVAASFERGGVFEAKLGAIGRRLHRAR